jgi:hypothetical protein
MVDVSSNTALSEKCMDGIITLLGRMKQDKGRDKNNSIRNKDFLGLI